MKVWNQAKTSHRSTGYNHPVYGGTNASLNDVSANVVVVHPAPRQGTRVLHENRDDIFDGTLNIDNMETSDRGGGVISFTNNPAWSTIYGIARCDSGAGIFCAADGAADWYVPLALQLLAGW